MLGGSWPVEGPSTLIISSRAHQQLLVCMGCLRDGCGAAKGHVWGDSQPRRPQEVRKTKHGKTIIILKLQCTLCANLFSIYHCKN